MSQSACFFQLNPQRSYILIGNRVRVKSLGLALGLTNARPTGSARFANAPLGLTRRTNAPQYLGGGGGRGGCWAQLDFTDALVHFWYILTFRRQILQTNRMFMFQYSLPPAVQTLYKTMFLCNIPRHLKLSLLKNTS